METVIFDQDISILLNANSFPKGVFDAHQRLHKLISYSTKRKFFGLSRPENGTIIYKAAAEQLQSGEAEKLNCDTLILKKGNYACIPINEYMKDIPAIGSVFEILINLPNIDPQGYCVEWYINDKDVKCMVRLNDE